MNGTQPGEWPIPHARASGRGVLTMTPDEALVTLGVGIQEPTLDHAQRTAAELMARVIESVREQGVAPKDIQTRHFSVHPVERRDKAGNRKGLLGYAVWNQLGVRVRQLDRLSAIIDAAVVAGATEVRDISFTVSNPVAVEGEARKLAVADARRKIDELAGAAGVAVRRVLTVTDGYSSAPAYRQEYASLKLMEDHAAYSTPIEAGEYEIAVEVEMVCEVADEPS